MKMVDSNKEKSDLGVRTVISYLSRRGYACKDVSEVKIGNNGYDIVARRGGRRITIEVKCSAKDLGIPDCFPSEFDKNLGFIADYLYIVRLDSYNKPERIEVLSRKDIDRYSPYHKKIERIRVSSKLKTDLKNGVVGKVIGL